MIVPVVIHTDREAVETYALLDDGSTKTVISEKLADCLSLHRVLRSTPSTRWKGSPRDKESW